MKKLRICLAQINPIVGDLKANTKKIVEYIIQSVIENCTEYSFFAMTKKTHTAIFRNDAGCLARIMTLCPQFTKKEKIVAAQEKKREQLEIERKAKQRDRRRSLASYLSLEKKEGMHD